MSAANTAYTVQLSTTDETAPGRQSAEHGAESAGGLVEHGEDCCDKTGSDGTVNGLVAVSVGTTNVTNANFGIEQPPTATDVTAPSQTNPGGTTQVTVPPLVVSDPEDGTPTTIVIATLPNAATQGVLYYNGIAVTAGQTIPNFDPALLTLDPVDGDLTADFTYATIDAAGVQSNIATVTMPFAATTAVTLRALHATSTSPWRPSRLAGGGLLLALMATGAILTSQRRRAM